MNPLPALDLLDPPQSVFDPTADDFNALIADDQANLNSLLSSIQDQQNQAAAALGSYATLLDQADAAITEIGRIFDELAAQQEGIDLSGIIQDYLASEAEFADQVNFDQIDLGSILTDLFNDIGSLLVDLYNVLASAIAAVIQALEAAVQYLEGLIDELFSLIVG